MATSPNYASTPLIGSALLGTAETNLQVPVHASLVVTPGSGGAKIEELVVQAAVTTLINTTAGGLVVWFLYDGTTYHLFDEFPITAVTGSATAAGFRLSRSYNNLFLPNGWFLYASQTVAGNASILKAIALGGSY
jgi:hypothetical protein